VPSRAGLSSQISHDIYFVLDTRRADCEVAGEDPGHSASERRCPSAGGGEVGSWAPAGVTGQNGALA
jgi:hypothetical protein